MSMTAIEEKTFVNRKKSVCERAFIQEVALKLKDKYYAEAGAEHGKPIFSFSEVVDAMQAVHVERELVRSKELQEVILEEESC